MRNSTRREATSGGFGVGDEIESAVAAMATACGSCAWIDVGRVLPEHARQPPGRGQVDLVARRQRDQVEPLGHALEQLALGVRHQHRAIAALAQAEHRVLHLALAAAPAARGIDVQGEHEELRSSGAPRPQLPQLGELQEHRVAR